MFDVSSRDSSAAGAVILFVLTIVVVIWLIVLALAGWLVFRFLRKHLNSPLSSPEIAPVRLFDAPPSSSWLDTYDQWLDKLEKVTGLDFTRTPRRLMVGALVISTGAGLVIGVFVLLLTSAPAEASLGGSIAISTVVGGVTGYKLSLPVGGWFLSDSSQGSVSSITNDSQSFVLGEDAEDGY